MTQRTNFTGFPRECVEFLQGLRQNNNKLWFDEHRSDFDNYVMTPARDFVIEMGATLQAIVPNIYSDPRVNRSIFRIHRDTSFSKDKTPYKTHLALWFWEGKGPRMECSGFYFHLEPPILMLGAGIHTFPKNILSAYREAVVDPELGPALVGVIEAVEGEGIYTVGGKHYKRVPRGYNPDHNRADLLLHNGLYTGIENPIPDALYSHQIIDYCLKRYKDMAPLHDWLVKMVNLMET